MYNVYSALDPQKDPHGNALLRACWNSTTTSLCLKYDRAHGIRRDEDRSSARAYNLLLARKDVGVVEAIHGIRVDEGKLTWDDISNLFLLATEGDLVAKAVMDVINASGKDGWAVLDTLRAVDWTISIDARHGQKYGCEEHLYWDLEYLQPSTALHMSEGNYFNVEYVM